MDADATWGRGYVALATGPRPRGPGAFTRPGSGRRPVRRLGLLRTAPGREEQERVPVWIHDDELLPLPRRLARRPDPPALEVRRVRIDLVDRDADPQSCAASRRLPALESDAKPVAADLASGPVAGDLQETERLVEIEAALDVGDSEAES